MRYAFLIIFLMTIACSNSDITVSSSIHTEPTRQELRQAMRYHGITFAEQDDTREWVFTRSGKRCRLFAYLDNENKQPRN